MKSSRLIIGAHGLGDCILSLQCASHLAVKGKSFDIKISTRQEVFDPLNHAFGNDFNLIHSDPKYSEDNALLKNEDLFKEITEGYEEVYYIIPDLLFRSPYAFNYEKYDTHPQILKSSRLLTHRRTFGKTIYLGLMTTTDGYLYEEIGSLAIKLAKELPDYHILLPLISKWAGQEIPEIKFNEALPNNLTVTHDINFVDSIEFMRRACYFVGTDNGPSHLAYHYGIPRLILDPQYGKLPWIARWKEDNSECVPIQISVEDAANIVKTNLNVPQTCMVARGHVSRTSPDADWSKLLFFKY